MLLGDKQKRQQHLSLWLILKNVSEDSKGFCKKIWGLCWKLFSVLFREQVCFGSRESSGCCGMIFVCAMNMYSFHLLIIKAA